jgi:hypothetical protein
VSKLWEAGVSGQRLGVWAASVEELKPKRGSREKANFLGSLERENPEAQPAKVKGMRVASNQWRR